MASRRADRARFDDRRAPPYSTHHSRRDDRYRDERRRDDRNVYESERARNEDRRRGSGRDDRRGDSYRRRSSRSRSPRRDRERSYRDDRVHGHDDRWSRYSPRDDRRRSFDRTRHAGSATPGSDMRPGSRQGDMRPISRQGDMRPVSRQGDMRPVSRQGDTRPGSRQSDHKRDHKREEEKTKLDEEAKKAARRARLEEWKKNQPKKETDSPAAGSSSAPTAPSTPTVAPTPSAGEVKQDLAKRKAPSKLAADKKPKQAKAKEPFKLADPATPAPFKAAAKPNGVAPTIRQNTKPEPVQAEAEPTKKTFLDDEENTGKRALQALPVFTPLDGEVPDVGDADEVAMSDIGSPEINEVEIQAQLEKRREEIAQEDVKMAEAPVLRSESAKMDVDDAADAEMDDIDPLDAFMAGLTDAEPASGHQGQTMFDDDNEPDLTAVEDEDLLAFAAHKKKKRKVVPTVDHSKIEYEPFRKNFYTEPAEVAQMTPEEVADLRHELGGIKVSRKDAPRPVTKWAQMGLLQSTMDVLTKLRFEKPTPIQAQAIPIAESGMDLIGIAKTGSGKTLAFGIPMIRHILDQRPLRPLDGPICLILAPTRELVVQIGAELKPFLKASGLQITCVFGGAPISDHIALMKRGGTHVLCATPGRLIDLLQTNSGRVLNFKRVTYLILDEADRMHDLGFEAQIMTVMASIRPDRQTILFSATFSKNMASLARKGLNNAVEITIGGRSVVAPEVTQVVTLVPHDPQDKYKVQELLKHIGMLYQANDNAQVLVFVEQQHKAEYVLLKLIQANYGNVNSIHGAKDQMDRNEAITNFKRGKLDILVATSVAARGLDVADLAMVFNFDCPTHLEDYVHRCGRTGRAGKKGTAITLIETPGQERLTMHIARALKQSGQQVPPEVEKMAEDFEQKIKSGEEKWFDPGFGGKGLDKLETTRALEKRREKRTIKVVDGEEVSDDEPELPSIKQPEGTSAANAGKTGEAAAGQPAYMRLLSNKIVVKQTERAAATGPTKPMTAKERAMAAANRVDGRLSKKGMIHHGQPIDNKGPDAGAFHSTIEINDFPQKARWAVTNRTNVVKILENTGVSITTKGTWYEAGREPGENELPKLYILVEGDNENVVTDAMMEITRLLREATMNAEDAIAPRGATGRYTVV